MPGGRELLPELVDADDELAERGDGVLAVAARRRPGMGVAPENAALAVSWAAGDRLDYPDRETLGGEYRALLDMKLEIAADPRRIEMRRPCRTGSGS